LKLFQVNLGIKLESVQSHKSLIQTSCPLCGKKEEIFVNQDELTEARVNHSLITKAISHSDEGHVLTLYIDGHGIVRRKYCFDLIEHRSYEKKVKLESDLELVFNKMIKNAIKSK